ncbi:thymidine kinase [Bacillus altitudinis]|uniref:thymidine kinase n=1 Tax=Bacillus altitudinis TaxID=293387 RepID=UPI003899CC2B
MPTLKAKLVLNVGGMFASKSTALIAQGKRHLLAGHKVLFIKPDIDNRYSDEEIATHDGQKVLSTKISSDCLLNKAEHDSMLDADVILIDEVQFFDKSIVRLLKFLLGSGKVIYCSGLDMDYKGEPFDVTMYLMGIADEVNKLKAVCSDCGDDSYVTVKTSGSNNRVEIGSKDMYQPVCRSCYKKYQEVGQ